MISKILSSEIWLRSVYNKYINNYEPNNANIKIHSKETFLAFYITWVEVS